jgi:hypothetical protein
MHAGWFRDAPAFTQHGPLRSQPQDIHRLFVGPFNGYSPAFAWVIHRRMAKRKSMQLVMSS